MHHKDRRCRFPRPLLRPGRAAWMILASVSLLAATPPASAQDGSVQGRFALFTSWSQRSWEGGGAADFSEVITMLSLSGGGGPESTFEFALDGRVAAYPSTSRDQRISLYEAWFGAHSTDGAWNLRIGQMWLHELGGLGSFGGLYSEYRQPRPSSWGRWRFALFGGYELARYELEYLSGVQKAGAYAALDGAHGRQHVLGYVRVRNQGVAERSTVVFSNYVPVGQSFRVYQALEYDTEGPAGLGGSGLTYFMANLNYRVSSVVGLQGTYHRGRSVDSRSITEDVIEGRPVAPDSLDGLLFESARLRVAVRPGRNLSAWAAFGADRNNQGDETAQRFNLGFSARALFGSAADINASATRTERGADSYDSLWLSLGYAFGPRVYVSLEYLDTLSVFHIDGGNGASIEVRPNSDMYSLTGNINLGRRFSLLLELELLNHSDFTERRVLTGLTVRF